jgi:DNA recombination protein RmuC
MFEYFIIGFFVGCLSSFLFYILYAKKSSKNMQIDKAVQDLRSVIQESAFTSLKQTSETIVKITKEQLDSNQNVIARELSGNRAQIENQTTKIAKEIDKLNHALVDVEKNRLEKHGELKSILEKASSQTGALLETTTSLQRLLSNSQARGQWGERIAEDILKLVGLVENINYKKQFTLKSGVRPDYTFFLPKNLTLNMDVKFPIENYANYQNAENNNDRTKYKKLFSSDIKACVRDVISKNYIDPNSTIDCVVIFVPHEQVFSFIQESSSEIFDYSLKNKIIICSPMTLFAVLSIIKKSIDTFEIEKKSQDIFALFTAFKKQWDFYNKSFDSLGKKITDVESEYQKLSSTRTRQLTNAFNKIEKAKEQTISIDQDLGVGSNSL